MRLMNNKKDEEIMEQKLKEQYTTAMRERKKTCDDKTDSWCSAATGFPLLFFHAAFR